MKISVVIPTRMRSKLLANALESLAAQSDPHFEAIVVCDGEDPDTRRLSESRNFPFPLVWIFQPDSRQQSYARNVGAERATGQVLLFLDDDATAVPEWVALHRAQHEVDRGSRQILVMGRTIHVYEREAKSGRERILRKKREERDAAYLASLSDPDSRSAENLDLYSVCGFNCSIRRSLFLESGGFDPKMRPKFEDVELGHRLHARGVETVVEPGALLYHRDTKELVEESRSYWYHSGRLAVYRMLVKGQRSAQVSWVAALRRSDPVRKLKMAMSWEYPGLFLAGGRMAGKIADRTGSDRFFRLWQKLESPVESWRSIREAGASPDLLREAAGRPLLVLAIHDLARPIDDDDREYSLSPERLSDLLHLLRILGFSGVAAGEGGAASNPREYALTFDAGYSSVYSEILPLVQAGSLKPLVFLVVDRLGGFNTWDWRMGHRARQILSAGQIREMHRYGVKFGSQTCTHPWLPTLSDRDLEREVAGSKQKLEDLLGEAVTCFAYPYGGANSRVRASVARAGYQRGFSTRPGLSFWDDPFWIRRVEVSQKDSSVGFFLKALTGESALQHTYELARRLGRSSVE